jgi:LuxR family maltose regulon positive regulatory protein
MTKRPNPAPPLTKLAPPSSESALLARPDVLSTLCGIASRKLAVVTAPTGSGKSTLLAQAYVALAAQGMDVCWLSLDASDNTAQRFVAHLIATLQSARAGLGADGLELLASSAALEDVIASLINDLTASERQLILFLDDFQAIDNPDIHGAVSYLLQYSPAGVRMVIASQKQPPLTVARLKARNAVIELGFDDLRFTPPEIRVYLAQSGRTDLSDDQVKRITEQTEGWICGLQFASLALDQRTALPAGRHAGDATGFAEALLGEVLVRQPEDMQAFLLATSVLTQFSAPLAEAVSGMPDAQGMIARLEAANLFLLRLDAERVWFRYHHLFSNLLKKRLVARNPAEAIERQKRAARWCEANGQPAEALRYALAAGDFGHAVNVLETYGRQLLRGSNFKELAQWIEALPAASVHASASLCALEGWAHLYLGDPVAASAAIEAGTAALGTTGSMRVRDELQIQRTMCGVTRYDLPDVTGLTDTLPDSFGPEDPLARAYAHVVLGYAARLVGDLAGARRRYEEAMRISELNEDIVVNLMARYNVAMVHYLEARPTLAAEGLTGWLRDARNKRWLRAGSAGFLNAAHAVMLHDTHRLDEALAEVSEAIDLLATTRTYAYVGIALSLRAQILGALGRADEAAADLTRAIDIGRSQTLERVVFRASLVKSRLASRAGAADLAAGCLAECFAILENTGQTALALPFENQASYHGALAEHLHATHRHAELATLADAACHDARRAGRTRFEIEFLVWGAIAHSALHATTEAATRFARAIDLAAASNVIQPFFAAGQSVLPLLAPHLAGGLRTAFAARVAASIEHRPEAAPAPARKTATLHQREVQILQLLGQGLRNREIGARLFVSEETVKWYLKKIYDTLGVGNRTHALVKAREIGVIA